jgi:Zn-dependent protease
MLQFRLFGFPVHVQFFFFLTAGLIGPKTDVTAIGIWIAVVFIGVLIHELGHASAARSFGLDPVISLHGMGGLTTWQPTRDLTTWQRLALSGAGPAAGIITGLVALLVFHSISPEQASLMHRLLAYAAWVNLGWGVLNLFPVLPLDGGQIVTTVAERIFGPGGRTAAITVSLVVLAAIALWSVWSGALWMAFLSAVLAVGNFQALMAHRKPSAHRAARREPSDAERSYDLAHRLAAEGQTADALEWLEVAIRSGLSNPAILDADPAWSGLRSDPRFVDLRRTMVER